MLTNPYPTGKRIYLLALWLLTAVQLFANDTDISVFRTWTNAKGQELRAKFISADDTENTLTIENESLKKFTIGIDTLSEPDQELIRAWLAEQVNYSNTGAPEQQPQKKVEIPSKLKLKSVPMVEQKENYCVPASAAMIAEFHDIKTDQDEIAKLSSGTWRITRAPILQT